MGIVNTIAEQLAVRSVQNRRLKIRNNPSIRLLNAIMIKIYIFDDITKILPFY